jgi:hypothetical protein
LSGGRRIEGWRRGSGRNDHPLGRLSHRLQLLHDLGFLRRQGPLRQLLRVGKAVVRIFFMMDESFLLYKSRALELLEQMKKHWKIWTMYVFLSATALCNYGMRQLVELGVTRVGMGFESAQSGFRKLKDADTVALTRELQSHGIRVQGYTIIGMEQHRPENIRPATSGLAAVSIPRQSRGL